jgi:hypothetical protein
MSFRRERKLAGSHHGQPKHGFGRDLASLVARDPATPGQGTGAVTEIAALFDRSLNAVSKNLEVL